jgi:multicomponent Na+:H+ antiporter subunit B
MTRRTRTAMFLGAAAVLGAFLLWGFSGLPSFGHGLISAGEMLNRVSVAQRHITDVVTAVNFDYRGIDTMGEEFIFFAAVVGVALIMRPQPGEGARHVEDYAFGRAVPPTSDAVRVLGLGLAAPTVLFALYVVAHGHLTPGGGFQGGVILATGVLLIYLAGEFDHLHGLYGEAAVERAEAAGAAAYVAIGFLALVSGSAFMTNVWPLGTTGHLVSAGSVPLINTAVGVEVGAGFVLLLNTFLRQTLVIRPEPTRTPLEEALNRSRW